jgi:hypothetical protein
VFSIIAIGSLLALTAEPKVAFQQKAGSLEILVDGRPWAVHVFQDDALPRPYFARVRTPSGVQVTRNHPPVPGKDAVDHAEWHPGIWLAFGDLNGADVWRNRAAIRHVEFVQPPQGGPGRGSFTTRNRFEADGKTICEAVCTYTVLPRPSGVLLLSEFAFSGPQPFAFGDQEEMGLGIRMATPLTVEHGGRIVNADGLVDEKQVWGKASDWCTYAGSVDGQRVGVLLMPDPANFRRSWFHVRDYGLMVANPFGRKALTGGEASRVVVEPSEHFRLRFGMLVFDGTIDPKAAYREFLGEIKPRP